MTVTENIKIQEKVKYESEQLDQLFTALAKAQATIKPAKKDSTNPFFKSSYADFTSVVETSRESLTSNGLSVLQLVRQNSEGAPYLCTKLGHSSGQWIESTMPINPPKADIQSFGSYITYLKRYAYAAIVGIVTEDDDGERATRESKKEEEKISSAQVREILELAKDHKVLGEFLSWAKIDKVQELPLSKFDISVRALKKKSELQVPKETLAFANA